MSINIQFFQFYADVPETRGQYLNPIWGLNCIITITVFGCIDGGFNSFCVRLCDSQSELHRNCSALSPPVGLNITNNETWCDWAPFGKSADFIENEYNEMQRSSLFMTGWTLVGFRNPLRYNVLTGRLDQPVSHRGVLMMSQLFHPVVQSCTVVCLFSIISCLESPAETGLCVFALSLLLSWLTTRRFKRWMSPQSV